MAAIDEFLAMLAAERGAAANTLAAYRRDLGGAETIVGSLAHADRARLVSLAAAWAHLAPASVARKSSALRQFYAFLVEEGLRLDDPSVALPRPATRRPLPRLLGHDEIERLFARAETEAAAEKPEAVRMLTLLELLYGSGLRATELVSLPVAAVPRDAPLLTVTGKGGQARMVPVSGAASAALSRWLKVRPDGRFLFPSRGGKHLTRVRLFQLLSACRARRYRTAKGQPARVTPRVCDASARRRS
jgi:integrase/recombinase XerD